MNIIAMILAGGEGSRLFPLTRDRSKPSVPFGGSYRIIDFVLSNFVNCNIYKLFLLTQFKSHSLMQHIRQGWRVSVFDDSFIDCIPPMMKDGQRWYEGTADAVYQNMNFIKELDPDYVCVFGGDHIYKMDIRQMINYHIENNADMTVAGIPIHRSEAGHFGIMEVDDSYRMTGFKEKPKGEDVVTMPGNSEKVLASMGNYVFNKQFLIDVLEEDHADKASSHDFGKDIIPTYFNTHNICVYDFNQNHIPGENENKRYWRDVGTIESYFDSNMDLVGVDPQINVYNHKWPIRSYMPPLPGAKFVHREPERTGYAVDSLISAGCIISGAKVINSVVGFSSTIHSYSEINNSVIMGNSDIGRGCRLNRCIVDKGVHIGPGKVIGYDREQDRKLPGCHVSESGIVVIPKEARIE